MVHVEWAAQGPGGEPESSDSMRAFGAVVQALREHAGLSREEFGARVHLSKHSVASIELGRRLADQRFVDLAEEATGNTGAVRGAFRHMARQPGVAAWFRMWARLEREAAVLDTYECRLVPGLLQPESYVRAVFENAVPPVTDGELDMQVAVRMERQQLLRERPNTSFSFIIEESVLRRELGGQEVTRCLLDYLLECAELRNASLQIMPLKRTQHASLSGPLQLAETPDGRRLAYAEGHMNGRLIADAKEVALLNQRYAKLRSQALTPEDSVSLLERLRGNL
ncbi:MULTISPECIES: helix-turn-helix domain-containing protein [Streptomyces]|uniref:Helix-turn-helix transcriptional regulator n=1 Tax=Streptomyces caniscabiei TaxID=2746961 RepID=A0ABU4MH13_9ACTN|nr:MULTISPECIES: helix-turn-helix transcriptional regulator [Streptomyces]MBE4737064.1 helix-turn-helix domain-containing protein [Streptomyces caniscabiei]MBE4757700.1 helix-turn-helix domain-containing protein [Streptomyces caniscabiei]MBE4770908.1 helix-turn-helix domain-containing protein [Streptomyces caniscabiei]MBE4786819.1 helix-turn-helix domain-containing protein [Streptomyces caniscabiei]MBE4794927.1 helix-turn-helix domain-containing protein [Streptomyces caniscabiei]